MASIIFMISMVLFAFYSIVPLGLLLTSSIGYSFSLKNNAVFAALIAIISLAAIIIAYMDKDREVTWLSRVLIILLLPMSLINWLCFIFLSEWKFTILCMAICSICAVIYLIKYVQKKLLKIIVSIICILIFIPLCFLSMIVFLFYGFGYNTIVQTIDSPNERYRAEVINNDQGALGGNTYVYVYEVQSGIDFYILRISKKPQCVYSGSWGEYQDMRIYWAENDTLFINDTLYKID